LFWYYVGTGLAVWLPIAAWMLWARHPADPDNGWGGFAEAFSMLLCLIALALWLIAVFWTWLAEWLAERTPQDS
jgi:hypothetical protein